MNNNTPELIYRSQDCTAEPLVYEREIDSSVDNLITKLMISKRDGLIKKDEKYYYNPSKEYLKHVAKVKRYKYLSA